MKRHLPGLSLGAPIAMRIAVGALLAAIGLSTVAVAVELKPGEETLLPLTDTTGAAKLYVPTNFKAGQEWPLIVFYHGTGGRPDTSMMRRYTGGRDFFIVGMPYSRQGTLKHSDDLGRELQNFRAALALVLKDPAVDRKRVFMGGVSKGGWVTSALGERARGVAGLIILMGGRHRGGKPGPRGHLSGRPIYIGVGSADANLRPSLHAAEHYARSGATVTLEEWAGMGHELPAEAPRLSQWLAAQGEWKQADKRALAAGELKALFKKAFDRAKGESDAVKQYVAIRDIAEDPRLRLCGKSVYSGVQAQLQAASKAPAARALWHPARLYRDAIYRTYTIRTIEDMEFVIARYRFIIANYPDSRYATLAREDVERVALSYDKNKSLIQEADAAREKKTPIVVTNPFSRRDPGGRRGGRDD